MSGNFVVRMNSEQEASTSVTVSGEPGTGVREYMSQAASNFSNIKLPMGGKITTIDSTHIGVVVPRISILDFWLQPFAVAELSMRNNSNRIEFMSKTEHLKLDGSSHVKQFKLADRFHMDVHMKFSWDRDADETEAAPEASSSGSHAPGTYTINACSSILVEVDLPPPFSFMPRGMVESAANAGTHATNRLIVESFVESLTADYARWAEEETAKCEKRREAEEKELEELRAAAISVLGTYEEAVRSLE